MSGEPTARGLRHPSGMRQPLIIQALARALAQLTQLSLDPSQMLGQLTVYAPVATAVLWTPASGGETIVAKRPAPSDACAASHQPDLETAAQRAVEIAMPFLSMLPCPTGDHQIYAAPATAFSTPRPAPAGALAVASHAGQSFAARDLLLLTLVTLRFGEALHRARPGQGAARQASVRGRLLKEVIGAAEKERKRLAHDIHDDTLQVMGMQLMKVQIIRRLVERGVNDTAAQELEALAVSIQENADRLRDIMGELRPSTLRDYGLLATIDGLIQGFTTQTGVPVAFASRLGRRLPDDHETMVYRIVQEALSNIRQHAGATQASITLEGVGDWYILTVEDDGKGFDPNEALERSLRTGHFGLITMRERAELIGGSLTIDSTPGGGSRLQFQLPRLA